MAQTIKIRRTTGNAAPQSPATVAQGELFYAYGSGGTYVSWNWKAGSS